jgi:mannose-6-phosphate isomerase-like protein (cupin superfamily)
MEHLGHGRAPIHDWRSMRITELVPDGSRALGSLVEVDVPAAVRHPRARSTRCQTIYYCEDGTLAFEVEGRAFDVGPGDVVVIEPGEWYGYENRGGRPVRLLSFNVPPYDPAATEVEEERAP